MKQPSGKTKRERNADRRERARAIYQAVMARAVGRCEACNAPDPLQWHHIMGGGDRRHKEAVETGIALCNTCHRGWEKGDLDVLRTVAGWAVYWNYHEALAAVIKRIDKIEEARR